MTFIAIGMLSFGLVLGFLFWKIATQKQEPVDRYIQQLREKQAQQRGALRAANRGLNGERI